MTNISTYLNCLSSMGTSSGIFEAIYNLSSGNSSIIYNDIFSTGQQFLNNVILGNTYPLIQLCGNTTGDFTSNNLLQFGNGINENFEILIQLNYNSCIRNTTGTDYVILSTSPDYYGIISGSGFLLGLNESNRLYIESSGKNAILDYELKQNNFLYLSVNNQQYISFGIYDFLNNNFNSQNITLKNQLSIDNIIYLGDFLNNSSNQFTGFSGNIPFITLFNGIINSQDLLNCIDCYFVTGVQIIGTGSGIYQLPIIQGYTGTQNISTGVTGYSYALENLSGCGGNFSIYGLSGVTGLITGSTTFSTLITSYTNLTVLGNPIYNYSYNVALYDQFINYNVNFYLPLMSGDYIEIYTYNSYNGNVNNKFDTLFDLPDTNLNLQIFDNGLLQLFGFDYGIDQEGEITGLNPADLIGYNLTTGQSIITPYSGWWGRSKILMSGGGYFPSTSQYIESGSAIIITGINNIPISGNTDLYLNGQKLISGLQYSFINSGQISNIIILSGNYLPDFDYVALYSPAGGLPTGISNVESNDLTFYPRENNPNYYLFNIQSNTNTLNNIIGFNPEIWINGIKNSQNNDFLLNFNCSLSSGFSPNVLPFLFYNNQQNYFNII